MSLSNPYSPNYTVVFGFESSHDYRRTRQWMSNNWTTSFYWVALYLVFIFGGQYLMAKRSAFKLRSSLIAWNVSLAAFSIFGSIRMIPEMIHVMKNFGFEHTVCSISYSTEVKVSSFWTWLFILSKLPELGDTVFVVLRKQRLIFLHWYHHITVLVFTWYSYADHASTGRWYTVMNLLVHSLMYSYYAIRALGYRVPRPIAMLITSSQIVQMAVGFYVTYYALVSKQNNVQCDISYSTIVAGLLMYLSYFVLFAHFFINAYFGAPAKRAPKKVD